MSSLCCRRPRQQAWVLTCEQILDEGWFGPTVNDQARRRLGDVAAVARDHWSFADPADRTPSWLVARHGSLSPEEMHVPLLTLPRDQHLLDYPDREEFS